jgi:hypothetical protein
MLLLAMTLALGGCGDLPSEPSAVQEQQMQGSSRAPGQPYQTSAPVSEDQPKREPVPGEVVPDR